MNLLAFHVSDEWHKHSALICANMDWNINEYMSVFSYLWFSSLCAVCVKLSAELKHLFCKSDGIHKIYPRLPVNTAANTSINKASLSKTYPMILRAKTSKMFKVCWRKQDCPIMFTFHGFLWGSEDGKDWNKNSMFVSDPTHPFYRWGPCQAEGSVH